MKKHNKNASQNVGMLPIALGSSAVVVLLSSAVLAGSVMMLAAGSVALVLGALAMNLHLQTLRDAWNAKLDALKNSVAQMSKESADDAELNRLADTWVPTLNNQLSTANSQMELGIVTE